MSTLRVSTLQNASSTTTNLVLDAFGNVTVGGVIDGLSTPAVATGTGSSSGGTLAAATYYVRIVAFDSAGNTTNAGPESTGVTTTGSTSSIAYTWAAITGATGYRVYFSTTSGTYTSYFVTTSASYTLTTTSGGISAGLPASNTTGISLMPNQSFMRNRIINGGMRIDQRNNGASITPADGQYSVDRFKASLNVASKFSLQQSTVVPSGFTSSLLATSLSAYSIGAGEVTGIIQNIEGFNTSDLAWGTAAARTVTLSFWVRSSLTGTFGGSLRNSAANRSYPFTYSISSVNTWEYKTVSVAGDTSGTWLTDNGIGISVYFSLGAGTTFSGTAGAWAAANFVSATGATSVVGTNGATFYITGVQLEVGSVATPFERRQYGQELMLCQRYLPAFNGAGALGTAWVTSSTNAYVEIPHPVQTRVATTGLSSSAANTFVMYSNAAASLTATAIAFNAGGTATTRLQVTVASGLAQGNASAIQATGSSSQLLFTGCEL